MTTSYKDYSEKMRRATAHFCFLNMSSPAVLRAHHQAFSISFAGALVNDNGDNMGLALSPAMAGKVGEGFRMESSINDKLAQSNLNIDRYWSLLFNPHEDPRDMRPLLYIGRVLLPMTKTLKDIVWKTSGLFTKAASVGPVDAQKSADMETIIDVGDTALPPTSDTTTHLSQAQKVMQIGPDACKAILHACLDNLKVPDANISVVDMFPHTGDMIKAFLLFQNDVTCPMHLHAYAATEGELAWLRESIQTWAREKFMENTLKIRGAAPLPEEVPRDLLEGELPLPQLHVCTWNNSVKVDGVSTLTVPDAQVKKYLDHADPTIQEPFAKIWTGAKHFINVKESSSTPAPAAGTPVKRKDGVVSSPPDPKKLKQEEGDPATDGTIMLTAISAPTCEATLPSSGGVSMKVVVGSNNCLYLTPSADAEVSLVPGTLVAAYYKGKWWHNDKGTERTDEDITFKLSSTDDLIYMGTKLETLGAALAARRKSRPASNSTVLYHMLQEDPSDDDPAHQTLTLNHEMNWKIDAGAPVKREDGKVSTMDYKHVASAVPFNNWNNGITSIVWTMRWTMNGLAPVRPNVALLKSIKVSPGMALPLNIPPAA